MYVKKKKKTNKKTYNYWMLNINTWKKLVICCFTGRGFEICFLLLKKGKKENYEINKKNIHFQLLSLFFFFFFVFFWSCFVFAFRTKKLVILDSTQNRLSLPLFFSYRFLHAAILQGNFFKFCPFSLGRSIFFLHFSLSYSVYGTFAFCPFIYPPISPFPFLPLSIIFIPYSLCNCEIISLFNCTFV